MPKHSSITEELNFLSKEAVKKGIWKYLILQDDSFQKIPVETLLSNGVWRSVKNVNARRQKDIEKILEFLTKYSASHHQLHFYIKRHVEEMETGFLGRSKLRDLIAEELVKINPLKNDLDNLTFLQSILHQDPEGKISALMERIHELEEKLHTAEVMHLSDQEQIKDLRLQIVDLQSTMRATQAELSDALEIIEKNTQEHQQSKLMISNLLQLLATKGVINEDEIAKMHPSEESKKAPLSLPIAIPQSSQDKALASTFDSSRSLMSVCSSATSHSSSNLPEKSYTPRFG